MLKKFLPLEPLWQLLLGQSAEKQRWTVTVTAARGPECCGFGRARPGASFRGRGNGDAGALLLRAARALRPLPSSARRSRGSGSAGAAGDGPPLAAHVDPRRLKPPTRRVAVAQAQPRLAGAAVPMRRPRAQCRTRGQGRAGRPRPARHTRRCRVC